MRNSFLIKIQARVPEKMYEFPGGYEQDTEFGLSSGKYKSDASARSSVMIKKVFLSFLFTVVYLNHFNTFKRATEVCLTLCYRCIKATSRNIIAYKQQAVNL